ncbi:MAG: DUF1566 domain-containing protein [Nitrospinaceae bacterium]|nr:DUF1566 domain-containing protein [Nitrospina sp.]MBT5375472.1 DUF1566 domain-containing protein [Nitrospinaceae bacterium]MBT5869234.1 DUF1566 domain-containing protein [Nitrospinaceae bacterium]MBT6346091.1 DUF1566 domain-containing protein [Nitrospina sp.]
MRIVLLTLIVLLAQAIPSFAKCKPADICEMMKKRDHFSILNECPNAAPMLKDCRKVNESVLEELQPANFVDNGDETVTDTANKLRWIKKGVINKLSLKDSKAFAEAETFAGSSDWRLPTLPELKTLLYPERIVNVSGKKAWINPIFDDGLGHYYWTTTTCDQLSVIKDRYQKKICQQGEGAAWLVHFNINAIFWFHTNQERPHSWLVQSVQ